MYSYNAEAEEIFDAWTSGTVIGAGKTLEAYYTVTLNGNGKYVDFQGNLPADPNDVIERVIYVKSDGLADHTSTSGWSSPSALQPTASTSAGPTIAECWAAINKYLTKFNGSQNNFTFLISYEELFFEGLLDDYSGAAAAYSLRRLDSGYSGDPIRVRRASDNTEADIPFTSTGDLDTDALAAHCGASNGYVKTWYDQSGNGNDATQTTTANQPKIYDSSTGVIEVGSAGNERPALYFDGIKYGFSADYTDIKNQARFDAYMHYQTSDSSFLMFTQNAGSGRYSFAISDTSTSTTLSGAYGTPELYVNGTNANIVYGTTTRDDLHDIVVVNAASDPSGAVVVHQDATTTSWTGFVIGNYGGIFSFDGKVSEIVIYNTDQSTNRTGIETNINDYYNIY
jgi:hypothetical protein